jgi:glycine/D-amino acid oxidase-like deaminating enzyme
MSLDTPGDRGFDAVVIGGGFYGCSIATYLSRKRRLGRVLLVEREASLLGRASYRNQARIHNGYHYPRSFTTAYRSRVNLPQFVSDWPAAVRKDFASVYAVARRNSKVNARQFRRFCREIGAGLEPVDASLRQLFDPRTIEDVFLVEEYVFDAAKLAAQARDELAACGVELRLGSVVTEVRRAARGLRIAVSGASGGAEVVASRMVFNCTYSSLNQLGGDWPGSSAQLKHEITEMALVQPPPALCRVGITVMDGPFFSLLPFPDRGLHTLSHVRYTPHLCWEDRRGMEPDAELAAYALQSRFDRMARDVRRYVPAVLDASYVGSLLEVKTVLASNEADDGRPILFERHAALPGAYSVLGGKIDNVYDIFERLDAQDLG